MAELPDSAPKAKIVSRVAGAVRSRFAGTLGARKSREALTDIVAPCLDAATLADQSGLIDADAPGGAELADLYLRSEELRACNPNPVFSEYAYRARNHDVREAISAGNVPSGLVHFLLYGFQEGRVPNGDVAPCFEPPSARTKISPREERYFERFRQSFPQFSLHELAARFIVVDGVEDEDEPSVNFYKIVALTFDHEHYAEQKPELRGAKRSEALSDYFTAGMREGLSPVRDFDEEFYLAFYDDVREAVEKGHILCGFHHYLVAGGAEGRLGRHNIRAAIEARVPGLSDPVAIRRVEELERKIAGPTIIVRDDARRIIHVVLPDLNPDIEYAGFRTIIELIKELRRRGKDINIVKTNSAYDGLDYFLYHKRHDRDITQLFSDVTAQSVNSAVRVGRNDRVLAYSSWDGFVGHKIASATAEPRFTFLIQEYEPIFYDYNSVRFLCDQAYTLPHFPVFNSDFLVDYFRSHRVGVFGGGSDGQPEYHAFHHIIPKPARVAVERGATGLFFMYARPEAHAGRNIFEVNVLALRRFIEERRLTAPWVFLGLGALTDEQTVNLGSGYNLTIRNRLPVDEYRETIASVDVGMSLMYAPHPSVVPFELLATGAVVVTNTFENRSAADLSAISPNLVPVDANLDDIVRGLHVAFERADDVAARRAGLLDPRSENWNDVTSEIVDQLEKRGLA